MAAGSQRIGLLRASLATAGSTAATGGLAGHALAAIEQAEHGPLALDAVVAAVVLTLGTVAGGVLATGCALLAAGGMAVLLGRSARRIEQIAALLTPAVLRRAVAVTVGTGLGLAAASGAATANEIDLGWTITSQTTAPAGSAEPAGSAPATAHTAPTPAPVPDATDAGDLTRADDLTGVGSSTTADGVRPVAPVALLVTPVSDHATPVATTDLVDGDVGVVTVTAGDSLWTLAAEHLPSSTDAAVAAAWPRWHEVNRAVIGADPDLIHPGQRLVVPDPHLPATSDEEQP